MDDVFTSDNEPRPNGPEAVAVGDAQKFADRISRLMDQREEVLEEAKGFTADIGDVFKEAKAQGFDTKALREAIRLRRMAADRKEVLGLYVEALGVFG